MVALLNNLSMTTTLEAIACDCPRRYYTVQNKAEVYEGFDA